MNISVLKSKNLFLGLLCTFFIAFALVFQASSLAETHNLVVGQEGEVDGVHSSSHKSSDEYIVSISGNTIAAKGPGLAYITSNDLNQSLQFIIHLPEGTKEFSHDAVNKKKLHKAIIASANNFSNSYSFIAKLSANSDSSDTSAARKDLIGFLPSVSEFRLPYCYGYELRYGLAQLSGGDFFAESTLSFLYLPDAAVSQALSGKNISLNPKEKKLKQKCEKILTSLGINNMKHKYEKSLAIHDYIVANTVFDISATKEEDWRTNSDSYSAFGALIYGKSTCKGYALAMKLLLEASGVECNYIVGTKNVLHAWNRVKLDDGKWYHIDASSNDPIPDKGKRVSHRYYALTDKQIRKTHAFTTDSIKSSSAKYSYANSIMLLK